MKYFEKALKFAGKYYILAIPLLVLYAIPTLVGKAGSTALLKNFLDSFSSFGSLDQLSDPTAIIGKLSSAYAAAAGAGMLSFLLAFAAYPSTYGMINKALQTGTADLNDFVPALKQNFIKYLLYWVGTIVIIALSALAVIIVFLILALLTTVLKWFGVMLIVLAVIAFGAAALVLHVLMSLWLSAMVVDDMDIIPALKKSIQISWSDFWTLLGTIVLIGVISFVANALLGLIFGLIPVIGPVISSLVPTASTFVLTIFFLMVYRDKTGKEAFVQ